MRCDQHEWEKYWTSCPYGRGVAEVTWPYETSDQGPLWVLRLCASWSFLPYIVGFIWLLRWCRTRGTRDLTFVSFVFLAILMNELVYKRFVSQMRPERSCLVSCGMPSSHSMISMGLLTLVFLDILRRVVQRPSRNLQRVELGQWTSMCKHACVFVRFFLLLPVSSWDELPHFVALFQGAMWMLLLYPIPLSRIALQDHTPEQVLVGSLAGIFTACVWWFLVQTLQYRYNHRLGQPCLSIRGKCILVHDFALPRSVAEQRVLADPPLSLDADQELSWYEERTRVRLTASMFREKGGDSLQGRMLEEERRYLVDRLMRLQGIKQQLKVKTSLENNEEVW